MLEPPRIERRIRLERVQWIGIPLLLVLPILALAGVFGERRQEAAASGAGIEMRVTYPARVRSQTPQSLEVAVTSGGAGVRVEVSTLVLISVIPEDHVRRVLPSQPKEGKANV